MDICLRLRGVVCGNIVVVYIVYHRGILALGGEQELVAVPSVREVGYTSHRREECYPRLCPSRIHVKAISVPSHPAIVRSPWGERRVRADRTTTYLCELCTIERECELLGDGGPVNLPPRVAQILNVINSSNVRIFSDILCLNDKQLLALIVVVAEGVTHNVICQEIASSYTSRRSHPTSRTYENLASTLQMC